MSVTPHEIWFACKAARDGPAADIPKPVNCEAIATPVSAIRLTRSSQGEVVRWLRSEGVSAVVTPEGGLIVWNGPRAMLDDWVILLSSGAVMAVPNDPFQRLFRPRRQRWGQARGQIGQDESTRNAMREAP